MPRASTASRVAAMTVGARAGVRDRPLDREDDWWRVRAMLVETVPLTPPGWNWDIRRWDGWRFHNEVPVGVAELARTVRLWETTADDRLLGAVHVEGPGEVFLELRPEARALEPAMLEWAEAKLPAPGADGRPRVELAIDDADEARAALAAERGYVRLAAGGRLRTMRLAGLPPAGQPDPSAPAGYAIRTTVADEADCARMAAFLNAAFRRTIHTAAEYRTFVERSPSFDRDLNLVAVAPDGSFAAHVGVSLDVANGDAIVEPVATHPEHRRLGLARILLLEGLRRAARRGARTASVETGDAPAANAFYEACGFVEPRDFRIWRRTFDSPAR